ncbi:hypothetical protein QBC35DRAFT_2382 [Podospora australis]|uniref:Cyclin-dependent kinase n=1 Tax=Podospora australis TaxID=1536484 RepID=A0AAN7ANW4_9PEZI|nr:hypothetical protein QBC35DRAFT_2382 [Podospora australis]
MDASPVKRRVLGALDPNASSPKTRYDTMKQAVASPVKVIAPPTPTTSSRTVTAMISPSRPVASSPSAVAARTPESESRKRVLSAAQATAATTSSTVSEEKGRVAEPSAKRPRLSQEPSTAMETRLPSSTTASPGSHSSRYDRQAPNHRARSPASPAASSIFDNSATDIDTSQVTTLTEPDAVAAATALTAPLAPLLSSSYHPAVLPIPPRPRLTREQARQKAEIIRSRLELANYKVRTGQTDVPLDLLEQRVGLGPRQRQQQPYHSSRLPATALAVAAPSLSAASSSFSSSFPGPSDYHHHQDGTPGRNRRPLPGHALVRRASQDRTYPSSSFSSNLRSSQREEVSVQQQQNELARRRWSGDYGNVSSPRSEQQQEEGEDELPTLSSSWQPRRAEQYGHSAESSSRIAQEALRQRRRTSTTSAAAVEVDANETEDEEEDGGAASGLLSLARG